MSIYVGIGGWVFPEWRDNFYPKGLSQKRELAYASSRLTAIEVNGTYYGAQTPESFARWHDETPEGFFFTLKGPRFATNRRVLAEAGDSIKDDGKVRRGRLKNRGMKTGLLTVPCKVMANEVSEARDGFRTTARGRGGSFKASGI